MNNEFETNGYCVVRNFFSKDFINTVANYYKLKYQVTKYLGEKKVVLGVNSEFVSGYRYYADTLCESILLSHGQKISEILGLNISPTYTLARIYEEGDKLLPHIDRDACEISATCPVYIADDRPSIIYISEYTASKFNYNGILTYENARSGKFNKVELYPGDVVFYKGCERYHWRDPLESPLLIHFFMHMVQTDGMYKDLVYDDRPIMGVRRDGSDIC